MALKKIASESLFVTMDQWRSRTPARRGAFDVFLSRRSSPVAKKARRHADEFSDFVVLLLS
jgi:hypothetical protein